MPGIRLAALVRKLRRHDPPDFGGRADADLLARFTANRDEAAFELLVWRHGAMVLAACRRVLGHTEDAEDAFQAAFLVLARKAGSVRGSVPAFLHRVAVRIALKVARKRRPTAVLELEPAARPTHDATESAELRGLLDAEIDRLSEPFRRAFVLCCLEGLSNADAARLIGCPVGTIESRLTAARKKLRDRLTRRNVELPAGAMAMLGAQTGLAKETAVAVARAAVVAAERGVTAAVGIVREPAAKLAQGVLVMTKLRTAAGVSLGVALLGLAAGVGWANLPADPPAVVAPEVAAVEPEVAPQPKPKDAPPAEPWPRVTRFSSIHGDLVGITPSGGALIFNQRSDVRVHTLDGKDRPADFRSPNEVNDIALSPDGKLVATAEVVNGVKLRDAATGKVVEALWPTGDMPAHKVGFSADGSKLFVLCVRDYTGSPRKGGRPAGFPGGTKGADAAGDRAAQLKALGAGGFGQPVPKVTQTTRLSVWDVATRKETAHPVMTDTGESGSLPRYSLAGHGRLLLKVEVKTEPPENGGPNVTTRKFTVTDPETGNVARTMQMFGADFSQFGPDALSPDGKLLALVETAARNEVRFFDLAAGKDRFRVSGFRRPLKAVAFSPDGKLVAVATGRANLTQGDTIAAPSEVVIWDAASGKELARLVDKESIRNYSALRFSPDGSYLVGETTGNVGFGGPGAEVSIWGNPPRPEPRKPTPEPKPAPRADVPDRFQSLFASLAANDTTDAKRVESLFLAALGRLPSDVEARTLVSQLAKRSDKAEAIKDLLGTLVETAEFKAHAEALGRLAK